eukprot:15371-Pyramimonas_sp.AAC.1
MIGVNLCGTRKSSSRAHAVMCRPVAFHSFASPGREGCGLSGLHRRGRPDHGGLGAAARFS